ncbi:MAG: hypothetical protein JXQ65_03225 [Candidatus Marinimicrobia bacterium]|nr:hypothetical protein [Candidatus Neomarinimicrobiota bacterium]
MKKAEFLAICLWKSRRPKNLYILNSDDVIIDISKKVLKETNEQRRIELLITLKGVSIPTASAILTVIDPKNYAIIDVRCVNALAHLGYIDWQTISVKNWIKYIVLIRDLASKYGKTSRDIEKGLFAFNRLMLDEEYRNLY